MSGVPYFKGTGTPESHILEGCALNGKYIK